MADKDDFTLDQEDSEDWGDYEPEKKGGSKRLLYLLLFLLVLAAGAVYMFVLAPDDGPSPPVKVVNVPRKPISMPIQKPAAVDQPVAVATPATDAAKPMPAMASPAKAPVPPALEPAPVKTEPVVASSTPAVAPEAATAPSVVKPKLFDVKPSPAPAVTGAYTLSAGAFVMQSSVDGVVKKIRKLGYEPDIQPIIRKVAMTRLLVGVYSPEVATRKLREVKKVSPGAFILNKGTKTAVYAGSFLVLDKARVFADTTLSENKILVTEESAKVDRTLKRVTFGGFANRAEAVTVARKLSGKGLDAQAVKK